MIVPSGIVTPFILSVVVATRLVRLTRISLDAMLATRWNKAQYLSAYVVQITTRVDLFQSGIAKVLNRSA
jgi:hypothetical protein